MASKANNTTLKIAVSQLPEGWAVTANSKQLKTPLGNALILPNPPLAEAIATEWQGMSPRKITKAAMPLASIACIAIDLVREKRASVIADILPYAQTDMLCYRAGEIRALRQLQEQQLDPVIAWAQEALHISLRVTDSIMPVAQPLENAPRLQHLLETMEEWKLAVLAVLTKPLSSLILALAVVHQHLEAENAFILSHLEENFETQKWGVDAEKEAKIASHRDEILAAGKFLELLA